MNDARRLQNRLAARLGRARLIRDRAGIAIVEFALLLPVLLTLFIGSFETANLLLAFLKTEAAAETAADLVAQIDPVVNVSWSANDFTNITNAVKQVMTPLPTAGLKIAYASVTYSTGVALIDWHTEINGANPITIANLPNGVSATTMGTAANGSLDSVIVARVTYPYKSPVSYVLATNWTLTESAFNRPRYVGCVATYMPGAVGNTANQCP